MTLVTARRCRLWLAGHWTLTRAHGPALRLCCFACDDKCGSRKEWDEELVLARINSSEVTRHTRFLFPIAYASQIFLVQIHSVILKCYWLVTFCIELYWIVIGLQVNGFGPKKFVKFIRSNIAAGGPISMNRVKKLIWINIVIYCFCSFFWLPQNTVSCLFQIF